MLYDELRSSILKHTQCAGILQAASAERSEYDKKMLTGSDSLPVPQSGAFAIVPRRLYISSSPFARYSAWLDNKKRPIGRKNCFKRLANKKEMTLDCVSFEIFSQGSFLFTLSI